MMDLEGKCKELEICVTVGCGGNSNGKLWNCARTCTAPRTGSEAPPLTKIDLSLLGTRLVRDVVLILGWLNDGRSPS